MTVDLNTCVRGQKCINKDGKYLTYLRKINNNPRYHHLLLNESSSEESYTNDGIYDLGYPNTKYNIVRIIPMESTAPDKHPSIAWWESCPWITDRKPTEEDADKFGRVLVTAEPDKILTASFQDVRIKEAWIHHGGWQPPVLSDKEQALELLNKHKDGVTMCVWIPTSEDWTIIRKGLTE
jgi:hypothetical protein